ncbi:DNA topoisomerase I [Balamuthia mandrillaris]
MEAEEVQRKWWSDEHRLPEGAKWRTLEHNGVLFPPAYRPHGAKMLYDGEPVELTAEQEEVATFYAQHLETLHSKQEVFNQNFFKDFRKLLESTPQTHQRITEFHKCDFGPIHRFLQQRKAERLNRSREEREKEKEERQREVDRYGWALVDGHKQKVGNFRVEPPGLFLGRGSHPKAGQLKQRVQPEDVTLNLGREAKVPACPIAGHAWGAMVHNNQVSWLACWKENISGAYKYVWLAPSSRTKGMADMKKFENARRLCKHIHQIRRTYQREMQAKEKLVRQRATAVWLVDRLALRVGNEKGDDQPETVGCCSLRAEHVKLKEPNVLKLDFLGKDSLRYKISVVVPKQVFLNVRLFLKGKKPSEALFDHLTATNLNSYLQAQMKSLTAKLFRIYNASITLEKALAEPIEPEATVAEKLLFYNRANKEVAILCNHRRSVPSHYANQMERLKEKKQALLAEKEELERRRKEGTVDSERAISAITRLDARIHACELRVTEKEELKTVALGTSKVNYLDPRITAAWCKRVGVPIEKLFNKTLIDKFCWAMDVDANWTFHPDGLAAYGAKEEDEAEDESKCGASSASVESDGGKDETMTERGAEEECYADEEIQEAQENEQKEEAQL